MTASDIEDYPDDAFYDWIFREGTIEELEELKWALLKSKDWLFAIAVQGRIDEKLMQRNKNRDT